MNIEEALGVLALAKGKFEITRKGDTGARVHYTGTDPEEEGRIAQALIVYGRWVAKEVGGDEELLQVESLRTDAVHVASDNEGHTP